jgi:phosphodiesterase/alkaline phosphatase D-like protein
MRGRRGFARGQALCRGRCSFDVRVVGATVRLTVTGLRPRTSYYYAVAARDNVSGRRGQRSPTAKVRTRR